MGATEQAWQCVFLFLLGAWVINTKSADPGAYNRWTGTEEDSEKVQYNII